MSQGGVTDMFRDTLNIYIDARRFIFRGLKLWENSERIKKTATKNLVWEKSYPNFSRPYVGILL